MTLAELRGGVMLRLGPPAKVTSLLGAVDIEIHNAIDDIRAQAKNMHAETLDRIERIDIVESLDIYPWPEDADEIRDITYGGFGKLDQIGFGQQGACAWWWADCAYAWATLTGEWAWGRAWVQLPGRQFRLIVRPQQPKENGLLIRYFPFQKRMTKATDEPFLPRQIQENIVPYACMRMASYEGIGLSHPRAFGEFFAREQERLEMFLQPSSVSNAANMVQDEDVYYPGGL